MRVPGKLLVISILALTITGAALTAERFERAKVTPVNTASADTRTAPAASPNRPEFFPGNYNCYLRVYVVEPVSRWMDNTQAYHYDFGFLGFGIDTALSIPYQDTIELTRTWSVDQSTYIDSISASNIEVMAILFNTEDGGTGLSDPDYLFHPDGAPYTIHNVDASAAATPGNPGTDISDGSSTHTVFIEESTAQTCQYCPIPRAVLKSLYESGAYNFLYAAMITNKGAQTYLEDIYNLAMLPTLYFDGGGEILLGGVGQIEEYTNRITSAGQREVPDVDLAVSMSYTGDYEIEFTVTVINNYFFNSAPDTPSAPAGPGAGLLEDEHTFSSSAVDSDLDQVYYMWDWGNEQSGWLGPYNSGETVQVSHTWSTGGSYDVRVKVKDVLDQESAWSPASPFTVAARGDANGDNAIDIGDAAFLINFIFHNGPAPEPVSAGNANCYMGTDVGDVVYLLTYIYREGPPPGCR